MAKTYRIHRVKGCGRGLWDLEITRRHPTGGALAVTGRCGESVRTRADLQALCDAGNAAPKLLAALRAVLPYAQSRLEDMEECARDCSDDPRLGPQADADVRKARAAFQAAQDALAAAEGRL